MLKKILIAAVALVVVGVGGAYGFHLWMVWDRTRDVLPEFHEPGPGPRAPMHSFLGVDIGTSTVADVAALWGAKGADCKDSSIRALMESKRQDVHKKMADAKAKGEDPDGVTGASLANYHSKKERNPQVRLACKVAPSAFSDRDRVEGDVLYWLIIFDSKDLPARHTSVQRAFTDAAPAANEYRSAVDAFTKVLGPPTSVKETPPRDGVVLAPGAMLRSTWNFADLTAEVSAMHLNSIRVMERMEVPWPVRPDAPARP